MKTAVRLRRGSLAAATALVSLFLLAAAAPGFGQQQLAALQGTITDQTGGVLPGVTVIVTNVDTRVARTTTTNERGVYRVPSVEPGRYEVTAELTGFR
jgi:protocatechuate 3,4-dioxygenase beta subunit